MADRDEIYALAFTEGTRALDNQAGTLDQVRVRSAGVLTTATVASAFLVDVVLDADMSERDCLYWVLSSPGRCCMRCCSCWWRRSTASFPVEVPHVSCRDRAGLCRQRSTRVHQRDSSSIGAVRRQEPRAQQVESEPDASRARDFARTIGGRDRCLGDPGCQDCVGDEMSNRQERASVSKQPQHPNGKTEDRDAPARPAPTVTIVESWRPSDDDA